MAPSRPLTDLCLIAVFKQLTPNDQLKAAQMSPRSVILVRSANRRNRHLKSLAIMFGSSLEVVKGEIDFLSLEAAKYPAMQLITTEEQSLPDNSPINTSGFSKWNCLLLDRKLYSLSSSSTAEQIANIFSIVTELKYFSSRDKGGSDLLIALLHQTEWAIQLTSLIVHYIVITAEQSTRLISVINYLTSSSSSSINLQVHLPKYFAASLLPPAHSESFCRRIVRLSPFPANYPELPLLCRHFPSLTSLTVQYVNLNEVGPLFTELQQLPQLVHLDLRVNLSQPEGLQLPTRRPMAQLLSVRALSLCLTISSHLQVEWLNLGWTLPRLEAIHFRPYVCKNCNVHIDTYYEGLARRSSEAFQCLQETLGSLHSRRGGGVQNDRIIISNLDPVGPSYVSLAHVMLAVDDDE